MGWAAAFGRLERMAVGDRSLFFALIKNPVGFSEVLRTILDEPGEIGCEQHDAWLVAAYLVSPERYAQRIADTASDRVEIAWQIRDFLRYGTAHAVALSLNQMAELTYIFARHSLNIYPSVGILIAIKIRPMRSDLCGQ